MVKKKSAMTGAVYHELADSLRLISSEAMRKQVADQLATVFRKRYPSFDPYMWERATGGKVLGYDIQSGKFVD